MHEICFFYSFFMMHSWNFWLNMNFLKCMFRCLKFDLCFFFCEWCMHEKFDWIWILKMHVFEFKKFDFLFFFIFVLFFKECIYECIKLDFFCFLRSEEYIYDAWNLFYFILFLFWMKMHVWIYEFFYFLGW